MNCVLARRHGRKRKPQCIAANDIHTGYDAKNKLNCKEYTGGIGSTGFSSNGQNVTFSNVVAHGFRDTASFHRGAQVKIKNCLFRNNFNGISFTGDRLELEGNVMWVHPNHQFSIKCPSGGVVLLINNLLANAQDMVKAGAAWLGCDEIYIIHNTFWIPANKPCGNYSGLQLNRVRKKAIVMNNILVNKDKLWLVIPQKLLPNLVSDNNLFYHHDKSSKRGFSLYRAGAAKKSGEVSWNAWQSRTGQDRHSIVGKPPVFTDAPQYSLPLPIPGNAENQWGFWIPGSAAEARRRFALQPGSPGKNAASDGKDIGICENLDKALIERIIALKQTKGSLKPGLPNINE